MQNIPSSPTGIGSSALDRDAADVERQLTIERRLRIATAASIALTTLSWIVIPGGLVAAGIAMLKEWPSGPPTAAIAMAAAIFGMLLALTVVARRWRRNVNRLAPRPPRPPPPWWHAPLRVIAVGIGAFIVMLWSLLVVAVDLSAEERIAQIVNGIDTYAPAFRADREWLRTSSLYTGIGRERDAGVVLNRLVPWRDASGVGVDIDVDVDEQLRLPALPSSIESLDFATTHIREVLEFDTSWMSTLESFDHWAVDRAPQRSDLRRFDVFVAPLPDFSMLQRFAKIRAVTGYLRDDVKGASADIQQLARLMASTDLLIGTVFAAALLSIDRKLLDADIARRPDVDHSWWHGFSDDDVQRLRRAAFASLHFISVLTPVAHWSLLDGSTPFDCVGIQEGLEGMRQTRRALEHRWPERYEEATARLVAASARCRFTALHQVWSHELTSSAWDGCENPTPELATTRCLHREMQNIPMLATATTLLDLTEHGPSPPFEAYGARVP